jgi:hypothetical protein
VRSWKMQRMQQEFDRRKSHFVDFLIKRSDLYYSTVQKLSLTQRHMTRTSIFRYTFTFLLSSYLNKTPDTAVPTPKASRVSRQRWCYCPPKPQQDKKESLAIISLLIIIIHNLNANIRHLSPPYTPHYSPNQGKSLSSTLVHVRYPTPSAPPSKQHRISGFTTSLASPLNSSIRLSKRLRESRE